MKRQNAGTTYVRLLGYLRPFWKRVIVLLICTTIFASLSGISLTLIPPFLHIVFGSAPEIAVAGDRVEDGGGHVPEALKRAVESIRDRARGFIYRGEPAERLARFCIVFFALMLIKNVFGYFGTYLTIYLEQSILLRIRNDLYGKVQTLPMSFFDREKTGNLISRITNDVTNLRGAIVGGLASIVRNSLMALVAVSIIFYTSWKLSLLTIIIVPVNILLIAVISRKLRKGSIRAQERMADITSVLQETISGVRVVKAFGMEDFEKRKFGMFNIRYVREYLKMRRFAELASPASETLGIFASSIILWYGGQLVIGGNLDPANLMMFIGAMLWVVTPVKNLSKLNSVVQEGLASGQRIFQILDVESEEGEDGEIEIERLAEGVTYDHVSFGYGNGIEVLRDVNFRMERGEIVAIVGASGAGKSTIADLLSRFYRPTDGRILIDGHDILSIRLQSLRALMGVVTQETILFNDSIFNNIAYGMEQCPGDDVVRAARAANAHEFIMAMPNGYDTYIGDRGVQLSGGQRQRIAIARALLKNPQILILDEATSSLDVESEALVQEAIDRLVRGRTTLVIAHRLSTIKNADKIIVLENGTVRQVGTHEELIGEEGIYRKLYDMQIRA
ncbi:MAG TPA: ABC transporter ATP-binding protein [Patescibacteria group bacterium]|nr:ABC transporter ATP-binding protein [Patescibacteria group bacterium]